MFWERYKFSQVCKELNKIKFIDQPEFSKMEKLRKSQKSMFRKKKLKIRTKINKEFHLTFSYFSETNRIIEHDICVFEATYSRYEIGEKVVVSKHQIKYFKISYWLKLAH